MTITLTENQMYAGVVLLLLVLQVYQQYQIHEIKKELKQVWEQMAIQLFNNANKKDKE
jgi:hypothetical protein